jgi:putative DNA primase/helicase
MEPNFMEKSKYLSTVIEALSNVHEDNTGRIHADCPFCKKKATNGQTHFSIYPNPSGGHGYNCFVCGASSKDHDGIRGLASYLGIATEGEKEDYWWVHDKNTDKWEKYPVNTAYDYRDEDGTLLYQALRYTKDGETKNFGQRQPDTSKISGWRQGTGGCKLVPYRLSEALRAINDGTPIVIVEGEKCVDYVRSCGIVATTNIGGGGMGAKVYSPSYCEYFRGASVVIVADNDKKGSEHAEMIATRLHSIATSVVVVSLPWNKQKGGLDDWLQAGNSPELFWKIAEKTPPFTPFQSGSSQPPLPVSQPPSLSRESYIVGYTPATTPPPPPPNYMAIAMWIGERLYPFWRYVDFRNEWLRWTGTHWKRVSANKIGGTVAHLVMDIPSDCRQFYDNDDVEGLKSIWKLALALSSAKKRDEIITLMKGKGEEDGLLGEKTMCIDPQSLDRHSHLLPCLNGIIDLRTGELLPHDPSLLYTRCVQASYNPDGTYPLWSRFLERVQPAQDVRDYLQRFAGYCFTGECDQAAAFFVGNGKNGKTTFTETLARLLGDYAVTISAESLLVQRGRQKNYDLASVEKARMVRAKEIRNGTLSSDILKDLVDTGTFHIERKYQNPYDIERTHSLVIYGNAFPRITDMTDGIWRRLHVVKWDVQIPESEQIVNLDKVLIEKEADGILSWAVEGAVAWYKGGLQPPQSIIAATQNERREADTVMAFIESCCVMNEMSMTVAGELYEMYQAWADEPVGKREFAKRVVSLVGSAVTKRVAGSSKRCYLGIGMKEDWETNDEPKKCYASVTQPSNVFSPSESRKADVPPPPVTLVTLGSLNFPYIDSTASFFTDSNVTNVTEEEKEEENRGFDPLESQTGGVTLEMSNVTGTGTKQEGMLGALPVLHKGSDAVIEKRNPSVDLPEGWEWVERGERGIYHLRCPDGSIHGGDFPHYYTTEKAARDCAWRDERKKG